jgi:NAD(P)-dependent dehydrogenase (short-subunit alcohol dehydrogenase family)
MDGETIPDRAFMNRLRPPALVAHLCIGSMEMNELRGKTLIVTGASLGIGRALALELAQKGVNVVLNARHAGPLDEVAMECEKFRVRAESVAGDVAASKTAAELVEVALAVGEFHGFIHAAGVLWPGPLVWELSETQFRQVFESSVYGSFQLVRHAVPKLLARGGGVAVFFGSGAAERQARGLGAYCAAKAAEEHLARQLAVEAPDVVSFIYRPGVVETRMQQQARTAEGGAGEEVREFFQSMKDKQALISPERAARALVRILSDTPHRFHGGIAKWSDA